MASSAVNPKSSMAASFQCRIRFFLSAATAARAGVGDDGGHVRKGDRFLGGRGTTATAGRHRVNVFSHRLRGFPAARLRLLLRFLVQSYLAVLPISRVELCRPPRQSVFLFYHRVGLHPLTRASCASLHGRPWSNRGGEKRMEHTAPDQNVGSSVPFVAIFATVVALAVVIGGFYAFRTISGDLPARRSSSRPVRTAEPTTLSGTRSRGF